MATVCLTVDFDAVSPWLHRGGGRNTPTNRSRGRFGAEVGAPRLLDFFDDVGVETTWFVPGHTCDSYPEQVEAVHDAGHGVQHHGWSHLPPSEYEDRAAERADLARGAESIERVTGRRPEGYRSPSWDFSEHTVDLLVEAGFEWDSSGMAREFEPYALRRDGGAPDQPYDPGERTGLVELPVCWGRDDYPPFAFDPRRGYVDERAVVDDWRAQFDWMVEHVPDGVYVLTLHPQVSGRGHRLDRLADLVSGMADAGASFERLGAVADRLDPSTLA